MVTLNRIYTRQGDAGTTRLATGAQVSKTDARVEAYGAVDETNAALGLARAALAIADPLTLDPLLTRIQNDLFDVGADLATPGPDDALEFTPLRVTPGQVTWLEQQIDRLNADLPDLTSFVLPAGGETATRLHVARTICRRAERRAVGLAQTDPKAVNMQAVVYLNRLSDLLFVTARAAARIDGEEALWVPAAGRATE